MRVILCGYHWTGCKALELLLQEGHEVYVYTHTTQNCIADLEGLCIKKNISYNLKKIEVNNQMTQLYCPVSNYSCTVSNSQQMN